MERKCVIKVDLLGKDYHDDIDVDALLVELVLLKELCTVIICFNDIVDHLRTVPDTDTDNLFSIENSHKHYRKETK